MTRATLSGLILAALLAAAAAPASAAERWSDRAVELQAQQIKEGFEIWKKALERRKLNDAAVRGAAGTIDVKEFLRGFERDIATFTDRFKSTKLAAPEALALLRRASDVERRVRQEGGSSTPAEWAALATQCSGLAAAYHAAWPIESLEVTLTRLTDKEMAWQLEEMARRADRAKGQADDAAKKTAGMDKAARESLKREIESVAGLAKQVAGRVKDNQPASVLVSQLLAVTASAGGRLAQLTWSQSGKSDWAVVEQTAATVAYAFGEPWTAR